MDITWPLPLLNDENSDNTSSSDDEDVINFIVHLGRPRKVPPRLQMRKNHFNYWDDNEFYKRFRMSKETTVELLQKIDDNIRHPTEWNHALTPMEMLLVTLRFFATGSFLIVVGDFSCIHQTIAGRIIFVVTRAIANLRRQYIKWPRTNAEIEDVQQTFYMLARFPRVIGAIDCTHVKINSPGGPNAEIYRNRKQFFSINVQTISDASLRIQDIVARWPGSVHDSTIFNNSQICRRLENGELGNGLLLGDAGYPTRKFLLTPLPETHTRAENLYNEAQIRSRNPVERSYGVWKRRFPVLSNGINLHLDKVQWVIVATAVLHNICIENNEQEPPELTAEEQQAFDLANNVPIEPHHGNINRINDNYVVRNEILYYFNALLE